MKEFTQFKFCPRCASSAIGVHMKNAIKCEACGYIYFHNTAAAVAAIVEFGEKILLIRRAHEPKIGCFDLPGGFVDYGESLDQALRREVREECNLELADLRYFGSFANSYYYREVEYFTADAFFLCRPVDPFSLRLSEENSDYVLVERARIDLDTMAFKSMKEALQAYQKLTR